MCVSAYPLCALEAGVGVGEGAQQREAGVEGGNGHVDVDVEAAVAAGLGLGLHPAGQPPVRAAAGELHQRQTQQHPHRQHAADAAHVRPQHLHQVIHHQR